MSDVPDFEHKIDIQPEKLGFEPFNASNPVREFNSGNPDLDSFLCTEEVAEYDHQNLGRTTLVYYEGDLVGFFTVCVDGLALDYVVAKRSAKSYVKLGDAMVDRIPSIKIGRLAVDRKYQNKGMGRFIMKRILGYALDISDQFAVRLIIVESKKDSIDFYLKCGFQMTIETKGQKKRRMALCSLTWIRSVNDEEMSSTAQSWLSSAGQWEASLPSQGHFPGLLRSYEARCVTI